MLSPQKAKRMLYFARCIGEKVVLSAQVYLEIGKDVVAYDSNVKIAKIL